MVVVALKPWARGPFELLRHADEHRKVGTDFDKRIALVGFDNAIEVSITAFLQLHPSQRGGAEFQRQDVEKWLANYHSKLDFLQKFAQKSYAPLQVSIDEIVWYHNLRNELYHSGNGMVPEQESLDGARTAALWVFSILFQVDAETALKQHVPPPPSVGQTDRATLSGRTMLLQAVVGLERALRSSLLYQGALKSRSQNISLSGAWRLFIKQAGPLPSRLCSAVDRAIASRNQIVHGQPMSLSSLEMDELLRDIESATGFVEDYGVSVDILPALKERYHGWVRPEIAAVRLVQKDRRVLLEIAAKKDYAGLCDESVTRTDLGFIGGGPDEFYFDPRRTAAENARKFVDDFDPYSIIMCTDLFTKEGCDEVAKLHGLQ